jgi:hypothetical protein
VHIYFYKLEVVMTNGIRLFVFLATVSAFFLHTVPSYAQATRTWVSGVGDDVNPCSRTAPCKTFAGAISKTASGGEIDALDPGGFGVVTITKPITLDGGAGQVATVLASGTNGIVVQPGAGAVILRNLSINGAGSGLSGIVFNSGASLTVENCTIFGFGASGIAVTPGSGTSSIAILNTTLVNNIQGGLQVKPTGGSQTVTVSGVQAIHNGFGIGVDTTGGGTVSMMVDHTVANENAVNGLQALGAGTTIQMSNSMFSHNNNGWNITAPAGVFSFVNNVITQNTTSNLVGTLGPSKAFQ